MRQLATSVWSTILVGYVQFFRNRLLVLDSDSISKMIDQMENETKQIKQEVLKLCWYMRGGVTYDEAMQMSQTEREIISEIAKDNMDTTKKTGLPFF